jgi:NAD(P)-dependent dehydrogenase (short-subunit alcohol dehydrogenase family)
MSKLQHQDSNISCFDGKVILITGAGGQLGREGCCYFARCGAKIAALDLSHAALDETYTEVVQTTQQQNNSKNELHFQKYVCDVTDADAVDVVMNQITNDYGRIDLLWNNAGYQGQICPILTMSPTDFQSVMNINVTGMFIVLQAVARRMVQQQQQHEVEEVRDGTTAPPRQSCYAMVNTASVAGLRGTPAMAGYASSKAAVIALTVTAAKELARYNIRCNAISPALIGPGTLWDRQNTLHAQVGPPYFAATAELVGQAKITQVPLQRLGTPSEVVQSVAFLLSDQSNYTTGINLTIDGGMSAGLKA